MHTATWVVEATKAFPKNGIHVRDGGGTVISRDLPAGVNRMT